MLAVIFTKWRLITYAFLGAIGAFLVLVPSLSYAQVSTSTILSTSSLAQALNAPPNPLTDVPYAYGAEGPAHWLIATLYATAGLLALTGTILILLGFARGKKNTKKAVAARR